jgi:DNA polymerase I
MGEGAALTAVPGFEKRTTARTLADYSGIRIAINQVEYTNSPQGPIIHIFGRDVNGSAVHLEVTGFRPYFYAPFEEVAGGPLPSGIDVEADREYRSIRGETLTRLYTRRPTDVREYRERFHHYEADIPFATRFLIDNGLTGGVEAPGFQADYRSLRPAEVNAPARICIFDIECEDEKGLPEPDRDKIIAITCWDSFEDDYTSFVFPAEGEIPVIPPADERIVVVPCRDEKEMLLAFARYLKERDPDIVSGWNILVFDIPYVTARMERLGVNPTSLARLEERTERVALRGRALFDLLDAYKKIQVSQKESYRLDAVAEEEVGETKIRFTGTLSSLWREDPGRLVDYNRRDVELCVAINRKNHIIEFYREIARYVGLPLDRTLNSSSVIDIYILRKSFGRFVLPSKGFAAAEEFEGATVFDPTRGVKENVVVLDLKSLYPMAMMTINASPETKDPDGEYRAPNGVRFRREPDGLTRSIIAELLREREQKKKLRDGYPFGSPEFILYDLQQNVLKVIMNTYYGVSGYARFRLYDREIGAAVTSVGRAIIEHTRTVIESLGYHVLYGDTDSCMVQIPPAEVAETIGIARKIEAAVNASYAEFAKKTLNADSHYFSNKFEKIYRRFFQAGKKKRYAGHLVWKEGKDVDEIDIVGFELRRSDYPQITKEVQRTVIEKILKGEGFPEVKAYLGEIIKNFRAGKYSLDEVGIPGGIQKALDQYETNDAHRRGAEYANVHLKCDFKRGSKPKRLYIKTVKAKYPKTDVLCFEYGDQVPPEFVVDWETMLEKTIRQPISRIIEALGWDWQSVDPSHTTLAQWGMG